MQINQQNQKSQVRQVSKELFEEWLDNPVTKDVMGAIQDVYELHRQSRDNIEASPSSSLQQIGEKWLRHTIYMDAYRSILDMDVYELPNEDTNDSETSGTQDSD